MNERTTQGEAAAGFPVIGFWAVAAGITIAAVIFVWTAWGTETFLAMSEAFLAWCF